MTITDSPIFKTPFHVPWPCSSSKWVQSQWTARCGAARGRQRRRRRSHLARSAPSTARARATAAVSCGPRVPAVAAGAALLPTCRRSSWTSALPSQFRRTRHCRNRTSSSSTYPWAMTCGTRPTPSLTRANQKVQYLRSCEIKFDKVYLILSRYICKLNSRSNYYYRYTKITTCLNWNNFYFI